jgi:hypothetical protein
MFLSGVVALDQRRLAIMPAALAFGGARETMFGRVLSQGAYERGMGSIHMAPRGHPRPPESLALRASLIGAPHDHGIGTHRAGAARPVTTEPDVVTIARGYAGDLVGLTIVGAVLGG